MKKFTRFLPYIPNALLFSLSAFFTITGFDFSGTSDIYYRGLSYYLKNGWHIPTTVPPLFYYVIVTIIGAKTKNKIVRFVCLYLSLFVLVILLILATPFLGDTFEHEYKKWW